MDWGSVFCPLPFEPTVAPSPTCHRLPDLGGLPGAGRDRNSTATSSRFRSDTEISHSLTKLTASKLSPRRSLLNHVSRSFQTEVSRLSGRSERVAIDGLYGFVPSNECPPSPGLCPRSHNPDVCWTSVHIKPFSAQIHAVAV